MTGALKTGMHHIEFCEKVTRLSQAGQTPYQIAGVMKTSYQKVIDVLKDNDLPVNKPTTSSEEAHRLAEIRHAVEDHQALIRERELEI